MAATVSNFRDLVRKAHAGELKLPGFQRNWRWRTDKVLKLFDSLRHRYPIGSFLFLSGNGEPLSPRAFNGSQPDATSTPTEYLVLDGQQRLTAGIHLYYASGIKQYYLDIARIEEDASIHGIDMDDEESIQGFCSSLDYDDGYLVTKAAILDPRSRLISDSLLCTSILTNPKILSAAGMDYIEAYPLRKKLIQNLILPNFSLVDSDAVPHINIDEKTSISAISRIFTTLNTTGQLLTPFELVVATLFPAKIDLQKEVSDFRDEAEYYSNMDATGEILLQTVAMLAGVDQKKANLPKSITASVYTQNKLAAFEALEKLGEFLTNALGCGLDATPKLIPYDAIFAPMACALRYLTQKNLSGPDEANAKNKLKHWFVASALTQRYQEGVHNKQTKDYNDMVGWLDNDSKKPAWISETRIPNLMQKSFDGAIGKLLQCLINHSDPRDPVVTDKKVGFRSGAEITEKHHIFPTKYVSNLIDWNKNEDKSDTLLNMMYVERATNKRWLNANPREHITEALKNESEASLVGYYKRQFISDAAFEILKKTEKTRLDFYDFIQHRQQAIREAIKQQFGFEPLDAGLDVLEEPESELSEESAPSAPTPSV